MAAAFHHLVLVLVGVGVGVQVKTMTKARGSSVSSFSSISSSRGRSRSRSENYDQSAWQQLFITFCNYMRRSRGRSENYDRSVRQQRAASGRNAHGSSVSSFLQSIIFVGVGVEVRTMTKVHGSTVSSLFVINYICRSRSRSENYDQTAWQQRFIT